MASQFVSRTQVLLREAVGAFLELSNYAHRNETDPNVRVFYSHLSYHCCRLLWQLRLSEEACFNLDESLLGQAVSHLGFLIPETGLPEFTSRSVGPETRLGLLSTSWKEVQRQSPEARLDFILRWLRSDISTEQRQELDRALECLADKLEKQQPKQPIRKPIHNIIPRGIGQPTFAVCEAAKSIYNALVACKGCTCQSQHDFRAKLELGTYRTTEKKAPQMPKRDFDVPGCLEINLFLSMERSWHEFRIQDAKGDAVTNATELFAVGSRSMMKQRKYLKVENLCKPISKTQSKSLQLLLLHLTGGQLYEVGFEKSKINKAAEPISLSQCFEERRDFFMEKTKRILSLIIAYTVLHLHGTSWLQPGWGSPNVKFFHTISNTIPLRPFIETKLPNDGAVYVDKDLEDDNNDDMDAGHRCLDLVALAVILMEITFVKPFSQLAAMSKVPLIETSSGRITLIDVVQVFGERGAEGGEEGWRSQIPEDSPLLNVIDDCLSPELWNCEGDRLDDTVLESRIYDKVVRPLEDHLTTSFGIEVEYLDQYTRNLDLAKWSQCIITPRAPDHNPSPDLLPPNASIQRWFSALTTTMTSPMSSLELGNDYDNQQNASQFFDDQTNDGPMFIRQRERYDTRKQDYLRVYRKFAGEHFKNSLSTPVRIAVLDTGIEAGHALIEPRQDSLRGKKNFYNPLQRSTADTHGHGTFTASLIMDYAPDAALYIGKIADKENASPDASMVAEAILHAVNEWEVDVISMSFGWPSSDFDGRRALEAAIDAAYSKQVLMFAAAANCGGRLARAYPASSPHVICVHSTDALGNRSDFSPTADPNSINLATVGECVKSAWPTFLCDSSNYDCVKSRSGTSYATPIIVGTAAFLLQYARLHLTGDQALDMKRREKMEAVLKRCAVRGPNYQPRDGYFTVDLSLDKQNLFGQRPEWVRYEIEKAMES